MRVHAVVLLVLASLPSAQASLVVTGFATNLPGSADDDAWEIENRGGATVSLEGVSVTDGEGRLAFPPGATLAPGARAVAAIDAEAYRAAARRAPEYSVTGDAAELAVVERGFALGQSGDELRLEGPDGVIDVVAWGSSSYAGSGWSGPPLNATSTALRWFVRSSGADTDTKTDWERPQQPRLGWREPVLARASVASGVAFTAPDQSRALVSSVLRTAEASLRLNVYEFRDAGLAKDLLDHLASHPGLDVRILVDETPVGMEAEERLLRNRILRDLEAAGATVRLIQHFRYPYDHAKYAVVDDRWVLVQTENLVPSAMPPEAREGNRGWGLFLDAPELARALAGVFDDDFALDPYGARALNASDEAPVPLPAFATASPRPQHPQVTATDFEATLVVGPEATLGPDDALLAALGAAREEILVEQLRIPPTWRDSSGRDWPNQYLEALLAAANRGVRVRVLLDGHFLDDETDDNAATVDHLSRVAGDAPLEARLMDGPDDPVLHVKGVVVDARMAWAGSMNWNLNSVAQNREVSLLVDEPDFAALFRAAFEADWERADPSGAEGPLIPGPGLVLVATVITGAALASHRRRR